MWQERSLDTIFMLERQTSVYDRQSGVHQRSQVNALGKRLSESRWSLCRVFAWRGRFGVEVLLVKDGLYLYFISFIESWKIVSSNHLCQWDHLPCGNHAQPHWALIVRPSRQRRRYRFPAERRYNQCRQLHFLLLYCTEQYHLVCFWHWHLHLSWVRLPKSSLGRFLSIHCVDSITIRSFTGASST